MEITDEQKRIARSFEAKAFKAIDNPAKFDRIMAEFEEWKAQEGLSNDQ